VQEVGASVPELVWRSGLRHVKPLRHRVQRSGTDLGLRCRQRSFGPPRRVRRQRRGALEERGGGGQAAPRLGQVGRPLEFGGYILVGPRRGLGPVPGTAIRVRLRIGGLRQGAVHQLPVAERGGLVGRRANQRMLEPHPGTELEQPGLRRRRGGGLGRDSQPSGGSPQQHRVAGRLGRRDHQQQPGRPG